jgi:hypothetical protein
MKNEKPALHRRPAIMKNDYEETEGGFLNVLFRKRMKKLVLCAKMFYVIVMQGYFRLL